MSDPPSDLASRLASLSEADRAALFSLLPPPGDPLILTPEPAPSAGDARITGEQIAAWERIYSTSRRPLYKWLAVGRTKHDPCPLDCPAEMPAWWDRCMKHRVPDKILRAANLAAPTSAEAPPPAAAGEPATTTPGEIAAGLEAPDLGEGEEVTIARRTLAAFARELDTAIKAKNRDDITYWHTKVKDAQKTFKEAGIEDREAQKSRGLLMSRAEAEQQIFGVIKMLAASREMMRKRIETAIRTQFPTIDEALLAAIGAAVESQRTREDDLFRDLSVIKSPADLFRLAA